MRSIGRRRSASQKRLLHALREIDHEHDLQPAPFHARLSERIHRAEQGYQEQPDGRSLEDSWHANDRVRAVLQDRHFEFQQIVRRIARSASRVAASARGAADVATAAVLPRELG